MNVLQIGAGGIGSRHLQSVLQYPNLGSIYVVDPNKESCSTALSRAKEITNKLSDLHFIDVDQLSSKNMEFAIIATPASVRLSVLERVLALGIKNILCEKVLFQSIRDYQKALKLSKDYGANIFANHIYRCSELFQKARHHLEQKPFLFKVEGGNNGLGCNLVHFLDLFYYLGGSDITNLEVQVEGEPVVSKRGSGYLEFTGEAYASNASGATFQLSFSGSDPSPPCLQAYIDNFCIFEIEEDKPEVKSDDRVLSSLRFEVPRVSDLTKDSIATIIKGDACLPTLEESYHYNQLMLNAFNKALFGKVGEALECPIT